MNTDIISPYDCYIKFDAVNGKVVFVEKKKGWTLLTVDNNFNFDWCHEILPFFEEDESIRCDFIEEANEIIRDCMWIGHTKAFTFDALINRVPYYEGSDNVTDYYTTLAIISDDNFFLKQVSAVPNIKNAWVVCDVNENFEVLSDTAVFVRDVNSLEEAIIGDNDRNKVMIINYDYCVNDNSILLNE